MHVAGSLDTLLERLTSCSLASTSGVTSAGQTPIPSAPLHSLCIIIDSLTPLLLRHPLQRVLLLLEQLRMHPLVSCVLTSLHKVSMLGLLQIRGGDCGARVCLRGESGKKEEFGGNVIRIEEPL